MVLIELAIDLNRTYWVRPFHFVGGSIIIALEVRSEWLCKLYTTSWQELWREFTSKSAGLIEITCQSNYWIIVCGRGFISNERWDLIGEFVAVICNELVTCKVT